MTAAMLRPDSGLLAEIIPNVAPTWHIARCNAGHENHIADNLAGRRFGVYVPLEDFWQPIKGKGHQLTKQSALFPGYVFIFVWSLAEHISKIKACPGITGLLANDGAPITVPDQIISDIQQIEWKQYLAHLPRSFFRRRRQQETWMIENWRNRNYGFRDPDPSTRIGALHRALGVAA